MALFAIDITLPRRAFDLQVELTLGAETLALVGPSGSGKTSLLRTVAGLERPEAGRISLGDEVWLDVAGGIIVAPERRRVGYLPQDYGLFPHLTVAGNVRFAGRRPRPDLLERLGVAHLARARPEQLSGGERQRVALARALAREPRVLLLDEPFGALDVITRGRVREELRAALAELALPALLVTHAFEDATALADRVGVLYDGALVQLATPSELLRRPASVVVAELTGANVVSGWAVREGYGSVIRLRGGGELRAAASAEGEVTLAVHPWALSVVAAEHSALQDRLISVRPERGGLILRTERFVVQLPAGADGHVLSEGALVGLRAATEDICVLAPTPGGIQPRTLADRTG